MSDDRYRNGHFDHEGDSTLSGDAHQAMANAFHTMPATLNNSEIGKNKKFLGVVSMDAGVVDILDGFYNVGADFVASSVRPRIRELVTAGAPKLLGMNTETAKTAGVVASIGSSVALKTAGYFGPIYDGFSSQWKEQRELIRKISPVLDDIKGNHSLVALHTTGMKDNEVIFAHRKRLGKIADNRHLTDSVNLAINSGTSLVLDIKSFGHEWSTRAEPMPVPLHATQATSTDTTNLTDHNPQSTLPALKAGMVGMLPQLAKRIAATNDYKLQKELQPYSALEMILELADQVNSDPKARGFTVPRSFQSPHGRREQFSLEEYLMRICIQHQKDMAYLEPQHTQIRDALREDLAASVKPLAEAIRKGDFNVLGLIRIVGEGKIIKKQGRAIAPVAEIEALIEREEPKQTNYAPINPNEYYKDASFSRAQLKSALKTLEGEDRTLFAAMFPDTVLAEAGLSKPDIKTLRDATVTRYDHMLAEAIMGMSQQSDEVLKNDGMARAEIEQIRKAAKAITAHGEAAVHDLKTSAVNDHGIEHLLTNVLVHNPKHLGRVLEHGRAQMNDNEANDNEREGHIARESHRRSNEKHHASKHLN